MRRLTGGRGVEVAYDGIGRETFDGSLACVGRRGMLVTFGNASGPPPPVDPLRLSPGSRFLTRPSLFDYVATTAELRASAAALFAVLRTGAVTVEVGTRWPLVEARRAHEALESGATVGSLLLLP